MIAHYLFVGNHTIIGIHDDLEYVMLISTQWNELQNLLHCG